VHASKIIFWVALLLTCSISFAATQGNSPGDTSSPDRETVSSTPLKTYGANSPVRLNGTLDGQSVWFGVRSDDVITQARLKLRFTASPALISELSHLKVLLNEEVISVIPLPKERLGVEQTQDILIDPRYITTSNNLRFQLVGHYTRECEDPLHTSVWLSISNQSELQLNSRRITIPDELSLLPLPFVDNHSTQTNVTPVMFGSADQPEIIHAAGVVASWLGSRSPTRAVSFPVTDKLPDRHAVLLLLNSQVPSELKIAPVERPTILVSHHPQKPEIKYLVLIAKDPAGIDLAAQALVLGQAVLTGPSASVTSVDLPPERKPYDSPNWAPTDRLTRLGDLVADPALLQVRGRNPPPVLFKVRIPPDLLIWERETIDLDLRIRYTPPVTNGNSVVAVLANNNLVRSAYLESKSDLDSQTFRIKLANGGPVVPEDMKIPSFQIGTENEIEVKFFLGDYRQGWCMSGAIDSFLGGIDADSTLDLRGHYHLAVLPDLSAFVNGGFPYSRMADLSETSIVLPDHPNPTELQTYLEELGRLGGSTGVPGFRHHLQLGAETKALENQDILVISTHGTHPLISKWHDHAPASFDDAQRVFGHDFALREFFRFSDFEGFSQRLDRLMGRAHFSATGELTAISGFESPLSSERSVVSIEANAPGAATSALEVLRDIGTLRFVRGDVVILRNKVVESYEIGEHYYAGDVPFWIYLGLALTHHPLITASLGVLGGILLALLLYNVIQRRKRTRLETP
jgi:cellulose synthase operon protein B